MNRKKLFIENIFAYGFITILSSIVPFLLLPVITRMLPDTSDYGVYDMYSVIVGFGVPLAVLGLYDAMFREYFEKDDKKYKYDVTTTAYRIILVSSLIISIILILFNKSFSHLFFGEATYGNVIIFAGIGIFMGANTTPIQAPTRMQNEKKVFVVSGLTSSIVTYGLSLILIYKGFSYFGLIYSNIITALLMLIFFWIRNKDFFMQGTFDKNIAKELLKIGLPLLPTFLIYWVYNSMDKIMIANMIGTDQLGIYSIGSKMAQVSQLIYAGFAGGWQYFAFSTMKDKDQVQLNSKIFEYLGSVSVLSLVVFYPLIPYIFEILFEGDYVNGYIVAPYLYMSPLLLMLYQIAGNQFVVIKKSYLATICLSVGAISNIILNFLLIEKMGIEGAAIATLTGYSITIIMVILITLRCKLMIYTKRTIFILILIPIYLYLQNILFRGNVYLPFGLMALTMLVLIVLYWSEIKQIFKKIIK